MTAQHRVLAAAVLLWIMVFGSAPAFALVAGDTLHIGGSYDYPPYSYLDDHGIPQGFSTALSRAVAEILDVPIELELQPWSIVKERLRSGDVHLVHDIGYSTERAAEYSFSAPYHVSPYTVFRGQDAPGINAISDLQGAAVVVVNSDIGHEYLKQVGFGDEVHVVADYPEALNLVMTGEYQYTMMDRLVGLYWLATMNADNVTDTGVSPFSLRYTFAAPLEQYELIAAVNGALALLWQTGAYQNLYDQWMTPLESIHSGIDTALVLRWGALGAAALLFLAAWALILRNQVHRKTRQLRDELERRIRSEESLRSIIEVLPDVIVRVNRDGFFIDVYASTQRVAFLRRDDMVGHHISKVLPADVTAKLLKALHDALTKGQMQQVEYDMRLPDDSHAYYEARVLPVNDHEVITFVRNITEAAEAASKLAETRASLERERILLRTVIDNIPSSIYVKDRQSRKLLANKADLAYMGAEQEAEVLGKTDFDFFPYHSAQPGFKEEQQVMETGTPVVDTETLVHKPDGSTAWLLTSKLPLRDACGEVVGLVGIGHDITERKKTQDSLEYLTFHDPLTDLYNRRFVEDELLRLEKQAVVPISVVMADVNGLKIVNDSLGHGAGDRLLITAAQVLRTCVSHDDVVARTGGDEFVILMPGQGPEAAEALCQSIRRRAAQVRSGPIDLSIALGHATKEETDQTLVSILHLAEDYMYQDKSSNSQSSRSALVRSLMKTLQEKSFETEEHAHNLQFLAERLALKLELTNREISEVSLLAVLHDLGKVAISEDILQKAGPLTDEEWQVMRKHPEIGHRIALSSPDLAMVADGILSHHEHWDGRGYPRGLVGEEIPLAARIVALADAFDAMTSQRPYSRRKSVGEAIAELRRCAGKQFDPHLVEPFIDVVQTSSSKAN